jgi:hypothetical protein
VTSCRGNPVGLHVFRRARRRPFRKNRYVCAYCGRSMDRLAREYVRG